MIAVAHLLGLLLAFFGATYALPILCSLFTGDGLSLWFLLAAAASSVSGVVLILLTRSSRRELKPRDGFLLVTLGWIVTSALATIPFLMAIPGLTFTQAFFETMSGLTSTGSTVLVGLDNLPPSLNFWRHSLQWFGGLGIIVMALAVLPLLGVGGMQLYKAETPGPVKDAKMTPRITGTVKSLWLTYVVITALGMIALKLAGMNWLDAVCQGFSAIGLGAFSNHDANIAWFASPQIELTLTVLTLIAALGFARHFVALRHLSFEVYARDPEVRAMLLLLTVSVIGIAMLLDINHVYPSFAVDLEHALFNVVSTATTSGMVSQDYTRWPTFAPWWLLFLSSVTSITGSAGGGIKMFRTLLLTRQAGRELKLLIHPSAVAPVRIGGRAVPERVGLSVLAFIFLYFMTAAVLIFVLLLSGLDFQSSLGAIVSTLNNAGSGLGVVGPGHTYQALSHFQAWVCTLAMLLGRLEIFSVLVLCTPMFWRK